MHIQHVFHSLEDHTFKKCSIAGQNIKQKIPHHGLDLCFMTNETGAITSWRNNGQCCNHNTVTNQLIASTNGFTIIKTCLNEYLCFITPLTRESYRTTKQ